MVGLEKIFEMEILLWLENVILRRNFANTAIQKRAMLQIFYAEYTENVLNILLYPESSMGRPWLGQENNFQNVSSQKPGKRHFMLGFCKCSKCFL